MPLILFGRDVNFTIFTAGSLQYSLEKILLKDPDVLLVESFPGGPALSAQLKANPIWSQLKAVQNNQVYEVNISVYVFGRGTHSLSIALADAMHKIYPEVFPQ